MRPPVETRLIRLGDEEVSYLLKRGRRRTVGLRVDAGGLTVNAPASASRKWLEEVLREKAGWVLDKLAQMRETTPPRPCWRDGESLPFLGGAVRLTLLAGPTRPPFLCGDELTVGVADGLEAARLEKMVVGWYRAQALSCFQERLALYADKLRLSGMPLLKLTNAATRWGSCNTRGELRLNWRLIKAPLAEIDYVVAHELAHLRHLDHSAAFWRVVAMLYPDYQASRAALRENGVRYHAF